MGPDAMILVFWTLSFKPTFWSSSHSQQKSLKCSTWVQFQKWQNDLCAFPRQTIQYHSYPSLCPNQKHWRSWSWTVLGRPIRPFRNNTQKRCPFHYRRLECKSKKSRNTWGNRQIWPWNMEWSRAKANRVLPRKHKQTPSSKNPKEDSKHGHHQMVNTEIRLIIFFAAKDGELYTVSKNKTGSWLWLRSWTPYLQIQTEESREND